MKALGSVKKLLERQIETLNSYTSIYFIAKWLIHGTIDVAIHGTKCRKDNHDIVSAIVESILPNKIKISHM